MVEKAHSNGIRIVFDAVFNHSGSDFFAFEDVIKNQQESKYKDWYFIDSWPVSKSKNKYYTFANGCDNMPKLNTNNEEVKEYLLKVGEYWIKEINRSNIKTIAFSFMNVDTRLKASNSWRHYLLGYKILISRIPKDIEIIIAGISSIQRVVEIKKISEDRRISIMHQAAWVNSRKGFSIKHKKQLDRSITKDEIFQMNLDFYFEVYKN